MKTLILVLVAMALAACAAPAQGPGEPVAAPATEPAASSSGDATTTSVAEADPAESPYDVVCRRERVTGSRMVTSVCHTRREWARLADEANELMRDVHTRPIPGSTPPGG
jgi:hypothetical protein